MKKTSLKTYLICFSILITLSICTWGWACGGWDSDYSNQNFTPEVFVDESLSPMFYDSYSFFHETSTGDHNGRFKDDIAQFWTVYLNQILNSSQVNDILFNEELYSLSCIKHIALEGGKNEDTSLLPINNERFKSFMNYMYVARSIDQKSTSAEYSWNEKVSATINLKEVQQIAFQLYSTAKNEDFKAKTWLLILKMYFYHFDEMTEDERNKCAILYHENINSIPLNNDYYRALGYMAGIYYKQKRFAESNYLYTQIFLHCETLSKTAIYSYHPLETNEVKDNILTRCKTTEEKCAMWALQGFYTDEHLAITEISQIDINSKFLPLLLSRAINKAEVEIVSLRTDTTLSVNSKNQYANVDDENQSLYHTIKQIAQTKELKNKFVWYAALGYMEMLHNKNLDADKSFEIARQTAPNNMDAKDQIRVLQLMNNLNKIKKITPNCFQNIDTDINWLLSSSNYSNAKIWVSSYLTLLYQEDKNYSMASLYDNYDSWYYGWSRNKWIDDDKEVAAILFLLTKENPSLMESTAKNFSKLTAQDIYDYKNVKAIFNNKLNDVSNLNDFSFPANPFNGSIADNHDAEHAKGKKYSYKKLVETMKAMQNSLANNKDVYNNALLLGNAFYSISHYGNCRLTTKLTGEFSSPDSYRPKMQKMLSNCDNAAKYYQIAYHAASNNEQRAKCAYMLAKCERNAYYNGESNLPMYYKNERGYDLMYYLHEWKGFRLLKEEYSNTQYFNEVINECGYFRMYNLSPEVYRNRL